MRGSRTLYLVEEVLLEGPSQSYALNWVKFSLSRLLWGLLSALVTQPP